MWEAAETNPVLWQHIFAADRPEKNKQRFDPIGRRRIDTEVVASILSLMLNSLQSQSNGETPFDLTAQHKAISHPQPPSHTERKEEFQPVKAHIPNHNPTTPSPTESMVTQNREKCPQF